MSLENRSNILSSLPTDPGIYQFLDENDKIIYIGKAKNIKKRVSSYFNKEQESGKTRVLVRKIKQIKFFITATEQDALLLENNLIKQHQPRYNILLKDDKSFPWICITNEIFPRIITTRDVERTSGQYFGPYSSGKMIQTLLKLIREIFTYRTCHLALTPENIANKKFNVCLEYHIKNCEAPCVAYQTMEEYQKNIKAIVSFLKGNQQDVLLFLKAQIKEYVAVLAFEKAQMVKEKMDILLQHQNKSMVVSAHLTQLSVFAIYSEEEFAYINYIHVVQGAIVNTHTLVLKKQLDETVQELLTFAILQIRSQFESNNKEIILPFELFLPLDGLVITVPKAGDKKKLLDLAEKNLHFYLLEKRKQASLVDPEKNSNKVMRQLQLDLRMPNLPTHIECFDNSNIQGTNPVAACVVFKNAKPAKKDYRHFNIKTVEGPNDFASMTEVVYRRYKRMLDEKQDLPQLIVIDGGKGQLSSALEALNSLNLRQKITIISIAKRLEEIYFPEDPIPLYLDKRSESLKLIQQLRDEAHRFGLTHHRSKRSKTSLKSELENIEGVGDKTIQKLILHFKSVENIKKTTPGELAKVINNEKTTQNLLAYFSKLKK